MDMRVNFNRGGRVGYVDLAKGICITLVAAVHVLDFFGLEFPMSAAFSAFRMPLYFFLSGLFFKRYESLAGFARRKVNKLLVPFAFFYLTTSVLLSNLLHALGYDVRNVGVLGWPSLWAFVTLEQYPNGPTWFLLCLFWVNIVFYCVVLASERLCGSGLGRGLWTLALSALCGASGYALWAFGVNLPAFFDSALTATPFFCCGYFVRGHTPILRPNKWDRFLPLFLVALCAGTWLFRGGMTFGANDFSGRNPLVVYAGGLCGTLAVMSLSKMLSWLPFLSHWGRYSIIILCTHIMEVQLLYRLFGVVGVAGVIGDWGCAVLILACVMFSYQLIIPLCVKLIPWFTAQRDLIKVR